MKSPIGEICNETRDLINLIDATMVEIVLYARGETLIYSDEAELKKQLIVQARAIDESVGKLDGMIRQSGKFFEAVTPPKNVPGQVLAIAEVIVTKIEDFVTDRTRPFNDFFHSLPIASRQELMERLRAYRDYVFRAAGMDRPEVRRSRFYG